MINPSHLNVSNNQLFVLKNIQQQERCGRAPNTVLLSGLFVSAARQAMVNIMLGDAKVPQRCDVYGVGTGLFAGQEQKRAPLRGQDGGWGQGLADHDRAENSSTCIFWSSIALGALLQGRSLMFVSPPDTGYGRKWSGLGLPSPHPPRSRFTEITAVGTLPCCSAFVQWVACLACMWQ